MRREVAPERADGKRQQKASCDGRAQNPPRVIIEISLEISGLFHSILDFIEVPAKLFAFSIDVLFYFVRFFSHVTFSCKLRMV